MKLKQWQNVFYVIVNANSTKCECKYQCECKNYSKRKENYSWNPSTCICENSRISVPKVPFRFFDKLKFEVRNQVFIFVSILKLRQKTSK